MTPKPALRSRGDMVQIVRPGERYAVERRGEEHRGRWLPDGEALPEGWADAFAETEARALLPFLRAQGHGRKPAKSTTADGRLIDRACRKLGVTVAALGTKIGAHPSVLSRARHGELPEAHRTTLKLILKPQAKSTA